MSRHTRANKALGRGIDSADARVSREWSGPDAPQRPLFKVIAIAGEAPFHVGVIEYEGLTHIIQPGSEIPMQGSPDFTIVKVDRSQVLYQMAGECGLFGVKLIEEQVTVLPPVLENDLGVDILGIPGTDEQGDIDLPDEKRRIRSPGEMLVNM